MNNRWSYQVVQIKPGRWGKLKDEDVQAELNRMGAMGWELVNIVMPAPLAPPMMVFKRPQ